MRSFEHVLSKILGLNWWESAKLGRGNWKKRQIQFCQQSCAMLGWAQGDLEEGLS